MNAPKVSDEDYINFLVATPRTCTGVEAARTTPVEDSPPAHDAFTAELVREVGRRGIRPKHVLFDSWYAASSVLHLLDGLGWKYVAALKATVSLRGRRCVSGGIIASGGQSVDCGKLITKCAWSKTGDATL